MHPSFTFCSIASNIDVTLLILSSFYELILFAMPKRIILNWSPPVQINIPSPAHSILKAWLEKHDYKVSILYWNLYFFTLQHDFLFSNLKACDEMYGSSNHRKKNIFVCLRELHGVCQTDREFVQQSYSKSRKLAG